jgi:hypothetical protein
MQLWSSLSCSLTPAIDARSDTSLAAWFFFYLALNIRGLGSVFSRTFLLAESEISKSSSQAVANSPDFCSPAPLACCQQAAGLSQWHRAMDRPAGKKEGTRVRRSAIPRPRWNHLRGRKSNMGLSSPFIGHWCGKPGKPLCQLRP